MVTKMVARFCMTLAALAVCLISNAFAADSLFRFQWALKNTGDAQRISIDHYTSGYVPGVAGEDVRLPEPVTATQKVIVAVLDTGIDYSHPQLKGVLASKGMNIINPAQDASDTHGHGTHIAGIIAAQSGADRRMNTGLVGVSNNVLILPVKVVQTGPNAPIRPQDTEGSAGTALTENVAKGLVYAIENGAQVINLSLAWPSSIRSLSVDKAMELAAKKNVIIVSSAGNDSTTANVYPCIYENVICVGAHGPDGAFSHYSNYGSMVDILAPGTAILSTWPMNKAPNTFAGQIGYEFRNGTSMAAPFVTGAIAELISRGYSANEAKNRILIGSRISSASTQLSTKVVGEYSKNTNSENKVARFGNLDIAHALSVPVSPLILPLRKAAYDLKWDGYSPSLSFEIALKNFWATSSEVKIHLEGAGIKQDLQLASIAENAVVSIPVSLSLQTNQESSTSIRVTVSTQGFTKTFQIPIQITRLLRADLIPQNALIKTVVGLGAYTSIRSVVSSDATPRADLVFMNKVGTALEFTLVQDSTIIGRSTLANISEEQLLNVYRLPNSTYAAIFSQQAAGAARPDFLIQYFDETLTATQQLKIGTDVTVLSENFRWTKMGNTYVPIWISIGYTPKPDLAAYDPWDPTAKDSKLPRIFFLINGELRTINLTKTQLPLQIVPDGRILIADGLGYVAQYTLATFEEGKLAKQESFTLDEYRMLVGLSTGSRLTSLKGSETQTLVLSGPSTAGNLRMTAVPGVNEKGFDTLLNRSSPLESLIDVVGEFADGFHQYYFVQTHYDLKFFTAGSSQTVSTSLNRYSYIPSMIFNRNFYPVVVRDQNQNGMPAIYIPATLANGYVSEVIVAEPAAQSGSRSADQLYRPASLRFYVSDRNCTEMGNLIPATEIDPAKQVFVCGSSIIHVPLTLQK